MSVESLAPSKCAVKSAGWVAPCLSGLNVDMVELRPGRCKESW